MGLRCEHVTFDCTDAHRLATFWAQAMGSSSTPEEGNFVVIEAKAIGLRALAFSEVPEAKSTKNRVHLDLEADDRNGEVARLVGLGASIVAERSAGPTTWTVLADPEGNEFCVAGTNDSSAGAP